MKTLLFDSSVGNETCEFQMHIDGFKKKKTNHMKWRILEVKYYYY